jgi:hypothetical protein
MMQARTKYFYASNQLQYFKAPYWNVPRIPADGLSKDKHLITKLGHDKHFCASNMDK